MAEQSFFQKLKMFCSNVESDISDIQDSMNIHAGTRPENYVKAMDNLKTEMEEIHKLSADIKSELPKLDNVKDFRCTLNEIIKGYKESILEAEDFMKKYGYKPPTEDSLLFHEEKETPDVETEEKVEISEPILEEMLLSPELSKHGKILLKGKDLYKPYTPEVKTTRNDVPLVFSVKRSPPNSVYRAKLEEYLSTVPPTPVFDDILTPYITSKSIRPKIYHKVPFNMSLVEENDPISLTQKIPFNMGSFEENDPNPRKELPHSNITPSSARRCTEEDISLETPESPVMSDITIRLLNRIQEKEVTPDSPVMSAATMKMINNDSEPETPDSPLLSERILNLIKIRKAATSHSDLVDEVNLPS